VHKSEIKKGGPKFGPPFYFSVEFVAGFQTANAALANRERAGNANLLIGAGQSANREIGVPGVAQLWLGGEISDFSDPAWQF